MRLRRGDVVLVEFPFADGTGAKLRPALVIQNDRNNQRLTNVILAAITSTIHRQHEPTQLFIDPATPTGKRSGLVMPSVVSTENIFTVAQKRVRRKLGRLPTSLLQQVDDCLKASLGIR